MREVLPKHRVRAAAFSLLEVIIAMAILGILTSLAIPYLQSSQATRLELAAEILAADLDYARELAVANNTSYTYTFSTSPGAWVLTHSGSAAVHNILPKTGYGSPTDPPESQTTELAAMPECRSLTLHGAFAVHGSTRTATTTISYSPLGALSGGVPIEIWLASVEPTVSWYVAVTADPITGLATVGLPTTTPPWNSGN
jgi:prepilin-type N-terminal cleavage/methylation domain-containing protein